MSRVCFRGLGGTIQQQLRGVFVRCICATSRRIVVKTGHNANCARGDEAIARRLPGRLFPDDDPLYEAAC